MKYDGERSVGEDRRFSHVAPGGGKPRLIPFSRHTAPPESLQRVAAYSDA